ncbi:Chaperone protein DnaJ [Lacticaseibacillus paracasei subsp. tolerans Lpl7]|uniref:DNA N-6-adenine-methyltransferase n=1 Tax=Lacticaseibacillus paracasei subsp. tolerans Lpl14 TaxID=1256229 RepID=A0A829GSF7_LACPA|nr:DNA N-6-adenine-methyltransferase [Lacticaseibacillus paracasei]EPC12611.1 Chaperone protein DnaJ [Lacticaseibacillus paracasei subsp. tolerans Lpl7]EPC63034.1 DNA N-6-adenine-methyltransferase [Lacticaseibacillus paracasei subsp. tolerans Lpl14]
MLNKGLFSSDKDDWETPQKLFEKLNDRYHFVIDLAATSKNAKCKNYYTVEDDALSKDWSKVNGPKWLNPPYGRQLGLWVYLLNQMQRPHSLAHTGENRH